MNRSIRIEAIKADTEALNVIRETLKDALASGLITQNNYSEELQKLFKMINKNRDLLNDLYNEA